MKNVRWRENKQEDVSGDEENGTTACNTRSEAQRLAQRSESARLTMSQDTEAEEILRQIREGLQSFAQDIGKADLGDNYTLSQIFSAQEREKLLQELEAQLDIAWRDLKEEEEDAQFS
jgi:hypothetical protein